MTKLTSVEADKLDNTCGNLRITKLGTHIKALEDFVNESALNTQANTVVGAINELYGMIVNNDCATIQIPPPGFFTLFGTMQMENYMYTIMMKTIRQSSNILKMKMIH